MVSIHFVQSEYQVAGVLGGKMLLSTYWQVVHDHGCYDIRLVKSRNFWNAQI